MNLTGGVKGSASQGSDAVGWQGSNVSTATRENVTLEDLLRLRASKGGPVLVANQDLNVRPLADVRRVPGSQYVGYLPGAAASYVAANVQRTGPLQVVISETFASRTRTVAADDTTIAPVSFHEEVNTEVVSPTFLRAQRLVARAASQIANSAAAVRATFAFSAQPTSAPMSRESVSQTNEMPIGGNEEVRASAAVAGATFVRRAAQASSVDAKPETLQTIKVGLGEEQIHVTPESVFAAAQEQAAERRKTELKRLIEVQGHGKIGELIVSRDNALLQQLQSGKGDAATISASLRENRERADAFSDLGFSLPEPLASTGTGTDASKEFGPREYTQAPRTEVTQWWTRRSVKVFPSTVGISL